MGELDSSKHITLIKLIYSTVRAYNWDITAETWAMFDASRRRIISQILNDGERREREIEFTAKNWKSNSTSSASLLLIVSPIFKIKMFILRIISLLLFFHSRSCRARSKRRRKSTRMRWRCYFLAVFRSNINPWNLNLLRNDFHLQWESFMFHLFSAQHCVFTLLAPLERWNFAISGYLTALRWRDAMFGESNGKSGKVLQSNFLLSCTSNKRLNVL